MGKTPGADGFMAIYYKTFVDILITHLRDALNSPSKTGPVPSDFLSAFIAVIPKPDKDPLHCASYRPIPLLNLDIKLMEKIIVETVTARLDRTRLGWFYAW